MIFAEVYLLLGTSAQVNDVAHGPFVFIWHRPTSVHTLEPYLHLHKFSQRCEKCTNKTRYTQSMSQRNNNNFVYPRNDCTAPS